MPALADRRARTIRTTRLGAMFAAVALMLAACSAGSSEETESSESPAVLVSVEIPDTSAGNAAQLMLDVLNADADADAVVADWEGKFHESFTAAVPLDNLVQLLNVQFRPAQPFTATAYTGSELEFRDQT